MRTATASVRGRPRRVTWLPSLLAAILLTGGLSLAWLAMAPFPAGAATTSVNQCNGVLKGPAGATTAMHCTVQIVNTIRGGSRSSTVTVLRRCFLDACPGGNTSFTYRSNSIVTSVDQCNASDNDGGEARRIQCTVSITNNISADTLGARPLTAATVNQCVGSGAGGGGVGTVGCVPFPASTTTATVTQCNGSGNGGNGGVVCTVVPTSRISPAVPIRINQCNGTGNGGGSIVTCATRMATTITAAAPPPVATPTPASPPTSTSTAAPPQVPRVPSGGVPAGGGSAAGPRELGLLSLGGGLLLAATVSATLSVTLRRRFARRARRSPGCG
jgi:hypothetical protein